MAKRKRPKVLVTLSMFDTRSPVYRPKRTNVPLDEFSPITLEEYVPAGSTPLRDAVGAFIGHLTELRRPDVVTVGLLADESWSMNRRRGEVVKSINQFVDGLRKVDAVDPDAAGSVLCVVVTDGEENSSTEIGHADLLKLVSRSEETGFTMIFLGCAIDAWSEGMNLGLSGSSSGQVVSYSGNPGSTVTAMASVTSDAQSYLSTNSAYVVSRKSSSMRSVLDTGDEVLSNVNKGA